MKYIVTSLVLIIVLSGCYRRIGDLTIIANRNVDSNEEYELLERNVVAKAKTKKSDVLEIALDEAVESHKGEFMKNTKIFVKRNGKKIKVEGDVWGVPDVNVNISKSVEEEVTLEMGDKVAYKKSGKLIEGEIVGFGENMAIIKNKEGKLAEVKYEDLTKLGE